VVLPSEVVAIVLEGDPEETPVESVVDCATDPWLELGVADATVLDGRESREVEAGTEGRGTYEDSGCAPVSGMVSSVEELEAWVTVTLDPGGNVPETNVEVEPPVDRLGARTEELDDWVTVTPDPDVEVPEANVEAGTPVEKPDPVEVITEDFDDKLVARTVLDKGVSLVGIGCGLWVVIRLVTETPVVAVPPVLGKFTVAVLSLDVLVASEDTIVFDVREPEGRPFETELWENRLEMLLNVERPLEPCVVAEKLEEETLEPEL
jgi:rhodanese-related sulfurtransferase